MLKTIKFDGRTYRALFVVASLFLALLSYLVIRDWHFWFNWFFILSIPISTYLWFLPFIRDDEHIYPGPIGKSKFERLIRHCYVIGMSILIAHSLTGFTK